MPRIFISYRRNDSAGHAGRLYDRLRAHFGADRVFMDVTGIEAGTDFVETIDAAVGSCDVLIAVIGKEWVRCADDAGHRRLELPNDFIRLEVGSALNRKVRVVPVLVEGALMPAEGDLPAELHALTRRQAVELRDSRWDADVEDLIASLGKIGETAASAVAPPSPPQSKSTPSTPGLSPDKPGTDETTPVKPALPWVVGIGAVLAVILVAFWLGQRNGRDTEDAPTSSPAPVSSTLEAGTASVPVAKTDGAVTGLKPQKNIRDSARIPKTAPVKPVLPTPNNSKPRSPREPIQIQPRPLPAEAEKAQPLVNPEPEIKPVPIPREARATKKIALVAWAQTSSRGFWNRLQEQAYSERMAALLGTVLRDRLPDGMEVQHAAARDVAKRITQGGGSDPVKDLCRETRATWVFAAHMEEPYAVSPAESAFWPELRLAAARCASPDPFVAKETLAPRQGEDLPFAHDMRAAMQRFVREQGRLDR